MLYITIEYRLWSFSCYNWTAKKNSEIGNKDAVSTPVNEIRGKSHLHQLHSGHFDVPRTRTRLGSRAFLVAGTAESHTNFWSCCMEQSSIHTGNPPYLANLVQWHTPCRTLPTFCLLLVATFHLALEVFARQLLLSGIVSPLMSVPAKLSQHSAVI